MREREVKHTKKYEKRKKGEERWTAKRCQKKWTLALWFFIISLKTIQYAQKKGTNASSNKTQ